MLTEATLRRRHRREFSMMVTGTGCGGDQDGPPTLEEQQDDDQGLTPPASDQRLGDLADSIPQTNGVVVVGDRRPFHAVGGSFGPISSMVPFDLPGDGLLLLAPG